MKLYKFFSLNDNTELNNKKISDFADGKIWCSIFEALNDPFEANAIYYDYQKLLENLGDKALRRFEFLVQYVNAKSIVVSFTANDYTNCPMWAHYANNHHGFCVEFDFNEEAMTDESNYEFKKVAYVDEQRNIEKFVTLIHTFGKKFEAANYIQPSKELEDDMISLTDYFLAEQYWHKHISWEYESEYRFIYNAIWYGDFPYSNLKLADSNIKNFDQQILELKQKQGMSVDISELDLSVSKIFVGLNCSRENELKLKNAAKEKSFEIYTLDFARSKKFEVEAR